MMKLFGFKQASEDLPAPDLPVPDLDKRYTRFPQNHRRTLASSPASFAQEPARQPCETTPVLPRRPSARGVNELVEPASLADQLHSEATISTSLLRRALPLRFADIDAETQEVAKDSIADLQAQFR